VTAACFFLFLIFLIGIFILEDEPAKVQDFANWCGILFMAGCSNWWMAHRDRTGCALRGCRTRACDDLCRLSAIGGSRADVVLLAALPSDLKGVVSGWDLASGLGVQQFSEPAVLGRKRVACVRSREAVASHLQPVRLFCAQAVVRRMRAWPGATGRHLLGVVRLLSRASAPVGGGVE